MIKRFFDFCFATAGLILLSPLLFVLMIAIRIESAGAAVFKQLRVGQGGRDFSLFKLRSMIQNADRAGGLLTVGRDSRITRVGAFLRASKLDELPQLWNVIRGDMSLVGPRPEVRRYVDLYTPDQMRVLNLRPGITDPASFALINESDLLATVADPERFYVQRLLPEKIRINLEYAARASLWTDTVLILVTIGKIFGWRFDIFKWLEIMPPELGINYETRS